MKVDARMTTQPPLHGRTFVGAEIVEDDVHVLISRRALLDTVEEANELLGVPLRLARAEHDAIEHAQRRIQAGRAVSDVVARVAAGDASPHPRPWRRPNAAYKQVVPGRM